VNPVNQRTDSSHLEMATFGAGCFWCVEALFENLDGVESVVSGYSGGDVDNPSYDEVCEGSTGHAEVCQVTYDMKDVGVSNIGKKFPEVTAESLAKTPESLPDSARGKVALITVAFLRESQPQLDSWLEPFTEKYGNREGFTFYEVPMISSGYTFMRSVIDGGMRAGIPKEKHKNVITMYGNVEKYMNELGLDSRNGYAFLVDHEGIIRWQGQGFATAETLNDLYAEAEELS